MKIYSFNVNGIRAAIRKGFKDWFSDVMPDILMIQETKAQPGDIEKEFFEEMGYRVFIHSAVKKGYSGVMTITKQEPDNVVFGIGDNRFDSEGRFLRLDFDDISVINSYFPSANFGTERQDFKYEYLDAIRNYTDLLQKEKEGIILSGDYNICHKEKDISKPEKKKNVSGFLPEERKWVTDFLESGFVDSFRKFDENPGRYSWWSYRANARQKNLGWRLDYHMVSKSLSAKLENAAIHDDIYYSDHCPVSVHINL